MSRERFVTRTITFTTGKALIVDITEQKVKDISFKVSGTPVGEDLIKAIKAQVENENIKVVAVKESATMDRLFSMKEEDFMKYATESEPRPVYPSQEKQKDERK